MNPYILDMMLRERRREMLEDAARLRLLAAYKANSPSRRDKVLARLGEYLIAIGEKLVAQNNHGTAMTNLTNPTSGGKGFSH
jgi:hypothetical protein